MSDTGLGDDAIRLCQALIRIDTTNPPGNERAAARFLADELASAGLEPRVLESAPSRANVVARLSGTGEQPPLLLTAHLDVVEADGAAWRHPPFSGDIADGCLWGRGAIDMKNMAAMSVAILGRLAREKAKLRRDVIFAGVADEEAGCKYGSQWLCAEHPDLVRAEYGLGEVGGFSQYLGKATLFPLQVAEKGLVWMRARTRGTPGHGSMPRPDSAVVKLAEAVARLGTTPLPVHPTPTVIDFFEAAVHAQPVLGPLLRPLLAPLLHPRLVPRLLELLPDRGLARSLGAMLSNTASPTVLRAGQKINVIPGSAECEIDGRTLPGQTDEDILREVREVMGPEVELEVLQSAPPTSSAPTRSALVDAVVNAIGYRIPEATVAPYMVPGFTDAKYFSRLGIEFYGFAPVMLPRDLKFADLFHGNDERIPVDGLRWGTDVLAHVVRLVAGGG